MGVSKLFLVLTFVITVSQGRPNQSEYIKIKSVFDGNFIETTENIEDPGPYNIYSTVAIKESSELTQNWAQFVYTDKSIRFSPQAGQYWNSLSTYKPCGDCFAATQIWIPRFEISGNYTELKSSWTETCLSNPGEGKYLISDVCNGTDTRQQWELVE